MRGWGEAVVREWDDLSHSCFLPSHYNSLPVLFLLKSDPLFIGLYVLFPLALWGTFTSFLLYWIYLTTI